MSGNTTKCQSKRSTGRLVVLNEEELIRQVSLRPLLYDRSLKSYRKSGLRQQYWKEVAATMGATVDECRRRWRSLRDAFSKHFKYANRANNEQQINKRKKWVFYDQMSFIAPFLDNSSCEIDEQLLDDFADNSDDADGIMLLSNEDGLCDDGQQHSDSNFKMDTGKISLEIANRRKSSDKDEHKLVTTSFQETSVTTVQDTEPLSVEDKLSHSSMRHGLHECKISGCLNTGSFAGTTLDSDDKFLLSCAPALRRLSHRKNALARLKIQQILFDIEFGSSDFS